MQQLMHSVESFPLECYCSLTKHTSRAINGSPNINFASSEKHIKENPQFCLQFTTYSLNQNVRSFKSSILVFKHKNTIVFTQMWGKKTFFIRKKVHETCIFFKNNSKGRNLLG